MMTATIRWEWAALSPLAFPYLRLFFSVCKSGFFNSAHSEVMNKAALRLDQSEDKYVSTPDPRGIHSQSTDSYGTYKGQEIWTGNLDRKRDHMF